MPGALRYQWPSSMACTARPVTSPDRSEPRRPPRPVPIRRQPSAIDRRPPPGQQRGRHSAEPASRPAAAPQPGHAAEPGGDRRRRRPGQPIGRRRCPGHQGAAAVARPSTTSRFTRKNPAGTIAAGVSTRPDRHAPAKAAEKVEQEIHAAVLGLPSCRPSRPGRGYAVPSRQTLAPLSRAARWP